ncbi:MAG TPA: Mpo1-like protein [Enhygromyxa sp.]|nr:Mpo1-like protein [Enhygromyxa sp.]
MRTAQEWLDAYGESHQNPTNKKIHWVCIPWIMISVLGLLATIPSPFDNPWLSWATGVVALAVGYYALISIPLAIGMALTSVVMLGIVHVIAGLPVPLWVSSLVIFVVAWIFQFIGHKIEGKKPSFFEDLQFLLIGPMWLLAAIYRRIGIGY